MLLKSVLLVTCHFRGPRISRPQHGFGLITTCGLETRFSQQALTLFYFPLADYILWPQIPHGDKLSESIILKKIVLKAWG